jgi:hypothetical protein
VSIAPAGAGVVYDVRGCGYGTDSFTYTISDGHGRTSTATVIVAIARPGQNGLSLNPITDAPASGFITGSTIGTTVPLRLGWCGLTRSGTSVRSYAVTQSVNGGRTYASTPIIRGTTATSSVRNLSVGTSYRWRARTTDAAGRTGAWGYSLGARLGRIQDTSVAVAYSSGWRTASTRYASGGTMRYTGTKGATATIQVTGARQFAIVGPRASGRGSFEVWVDGAKVATVSERATGNAYRRVLYVRSLAGGAGVTHTIVIRAVGNGRVDLDAVLSLS